MHNKEEKCEETTVRNVPYMKANKKQQETLQKETPIKARQKKMVRRLNQNRCHNTVFGLVHYSWLVPAMIL